MIRYFNISCLSSILLATCTLASGNVFAESKAFAALINTSEFIQQSTDPNCLILGSSKGDGKSNLFSKAASSFTNVVLSATDCVYLDEKFNPARFDQGKFTLAAELVPGQLLDRDSITASYQGTLTRNYDGTYTLAGTFSVTGGTGKYVGANGSGILSGTETIENFAAQGQLKAVGKINY